MYFEFSLRGLLTALFRKRDVFLLVFSFVFLAGGLYVLHRPPTYESKGSFLIRFDQGALPAADSAGDGRGMEFSGDGRAEMLQSNVALIESDDLLQDVVRSVGASRIYPGIDDGKGAETAVLSAVARLRAKGLKVESDPRSDVIAFSVFNGDPAVARDVAARIMQVFTARQSVIFGAPHTVFLQQQADAMRGKMERSEQDLRDFKRMNGITLLDEEVTQLLAEKKDLSVRAFQAMSDGQAVIARLEKNRAEMEATYRPDSPVIQRIDESLAAARAEAQEENSGNGAFAARIAVVDKRLALLEANRRRYHDLEQRVALDTENYKFYQLRNDEARVSERLNRENITRISVIDRPAVPPEPVNGHRALFLFAVLMAASLLGLGAVIFLELIDDTVVFNEQVIAATGLPVLASFGR
ncbi:MAG: hypothetical protein KGL10_09220 [Alphaproteobacteria bacterium]|nr:hypothetical protein [Alphaproteobacteria bacterium]MDE2337479.1 hypothetical protein [Alphaproteobacteria bacterium]